MTAAMSSCAADNKYAVRGVDYFTYFVFFSASCYLLLILLRKEITWLKGEFYFSILGRTTLNEESLDLDSNKKNRPYYMHPCDFRWPSSSAPMTKQNAREISEEIDK